MAHLITTKNDVIKEDKYPLVGDTTIIGRHPCCEVVIDFGAVSREHARILHESNGYFIEDLHSRNGTYHNGKQIHSRIQLFNGDKIRICDFEFVFIGDPVDQVYARVPEISNSGNHIIIDEDNGKEESYNITSQINLESNKVHINSANAEVKLRALVDIGRNLGADLEEVLPQLLDNILRIFRQADCAYILLNNDSGNRLELKAFKHRDPHCHESFRISRSILEKVSSTKSAILSDDIGNDSRFDPSESIVSFHISSVMAAPILGADQTECLGVIQVDSRSGDKKFSYNDLDLLVSIAFQMAVAIENAKLHEVVIHDKIMERELCVAHEVQRGLLPISHPKIKGYEFFDFYEPAKYLGGDYFDYIPLPNGEIAVALGDVSGKGISAALLMAKLSSEVRYGLLMENSLTKTMQRLNATFCESRWENRFVTFLLTVLEPKSGNVRILNAGHFAPLLIDPEGGTTQFGQESNGLPFGIAEDAEYKEVTVTLKNGMTLVMLSDGITDAMNAENECFSLLRVIKTFNELAKSPVSNMGRNLISAIRSFAGKTPQTDDQCLVIFGRR